MLKKLLTKISRVSACLMAAGIACGLAAAQAQTIPAAMLDTPATGKQTIVLSGGCFWGVQAVFQHTRGVTEAVAGYAGGAADTAHYEVVSTGDTGHAESVKVTYDPSKISFGTLLKVYFSIAHDPTELNHQGPDSGTQYRSEIYYTTPEQKKIADAYITQLDAAKAFPDKIVTKVEPLPAFYAAEGYHQNYLMLHPENPYIVINDMPKLAALQKVYPDLYTAVAGAK